MDDYLKHAVELVKAQASVRVLSAEEMESMISSLAGKLKKMDCSEEGCPAECAATESPAVDVKRSIKEKHIVCLECGKTFKVITKKHLARHQLDPASYREKWGLKKDTPLICKELQRTRRTKMRSMKLWEKRAMAREMAK